jgi:hypothetical protein
MEDKQVKDGDQRRVFKRGCGWLRHWFASRARNPAKQNAWTEFTLAGNICGGTGRRKKAA